MKHMHHKALKILVYGDTLWSVNQSVVNDAEGLKAYLALRSPQTTHVMVDLEDGWLDSEQQMLDTVVKSGRVMADVQELLPDEIKSGRYAITRYPWIPTRDLMAQIEFLAPSYYVDGFLNVNELTAVASFAVKCQNLYNVIKIDRLPVYLCVNIYPKESGADPSGFSFTPMGLDVWKLMLDTAKQCGIDGLIVFNPYLCDGLYAAQREKFIAEWLPYLSILKSVCGA